MRGSTVYNICSIAPLHHSAVSFFFLSSRLGTHYHSFLFAVLGISTMAVRPLPGASYHTLGGVFHSFPDVELESTGSSNVCDPPEKFCPSNESTPLLDRTPDNRKRSRRGLPLLLSILVFFCLLFTASAFSGYPTHRRLMPDVPDRHASIAIQAQSNRALVNENYDGALVAKCVQSSIANTFFPLILVKI